MTIKNKIIKDTAIDFLLWKSKKGFYAQGFTNHTNNDIPLWIRQENQLCFSTPISSNQLFELYQQEKKIEYEEYVVKPNLPFDKNLIG